LMLPSATLKEKGLDLPWVVHIDAEGSEGLIFKGGEKFFAQRQFSSKPQLRDYFSNSSNSAA